MVAADRGEVGGVTKVWRYDHTLGISESMGRSHKCYTYAYERHQEGCRYYLCPCPAIDLRELPTVVSSGTVDSEILKGRLRQQNAR
jgi:hypothetical protein